MGEPMVPLKANRNNSVSRDSAGRGKSLKSRGKNGN